MFHYWKIHSAPSEFPLLLPTDGPWRIWTSPTHMSKIHPCTITPSTCTHWQTAMAIFRINSVLGVSSKLFEDAAPPYITISMLSFLVSINDSTESRTPTTALSHVRPPTARFLFLSLCITSFNLIRGSPHLSLLELPHLQVPFQGPCPLISLPWMVLFIPTRWQNCDHTTSARPYNNIKYKYGQYQSPVHTIHLWCGPGYAQVALKSVATHRIWLLTIGRENVLSRLPYTPLTFIHHNHTWSGSSQADQFSLGRNWVLHLLPSHQAA